MEHKKIEALWDCVYCSTKGIGGSQMNCPNCGQPRGKEIRFYLPTDPSDYKEVDTTKVKVSEQPDWLCAYCGSYNKAETDGCKGCGAARTESKADYRRIQTDKQ